MEEISNENSERSDLISVTPHEEKKKIRLIAPEKNLFKDFSLWLLVGLLASLIFLFLGLTNNKSFYVLTPLGPLAAIIGWFTKKVFKKFEDKDPLSH